MQETQSFIHPYLFAFLVFSMAVYTRHFYKKHNNTIQESITEFYFLYNRFFTSMNQVLYPTLYEDETNTNTSEQNNTNNDNNNNNNNKNNNNNNNNNNNKYEDKYLNIIKKTKPEFEFTDEEKIEIGNIFNLKAKQNTQFYEEKIDTLNKELQHIKTEVQSLLDMTDERFAELFNKKDNDECDEYDEDDKNDISPILIKEHVIKEKQHKWLELEKELAQLESKVEDIDTINKEALDYANNIIVEKRINKLNGCFVMETTPIGNVLLTYNPKRLSFSYYSDSTIPYRYLEVVARKFVKTFHCRPLFVDMDEELKNIEKKWEEHRKQEEERENSKVMEEPKEKQVKNVFAKLKNYNKSTGKVNTAPPPKSSIPTGPFSNKSEQKDKLLLKENANRYTYEGKISTFQMLKKVERKVVDKKYAMTFADFKKLQNK